MPDAAPNAGWKPVKPRPFTATPLGVSEVLTVAEHDLFGTKDVQDAITASYVWMADQIGHVFLGLAPTLLLCWLWRWLSALRGVQEAFSGPLLGDGPLDPNPLNAGYIVVALPAFAYWVSKELQDRTDSIAEAGHVFPFDGKDIWRNVAVALLFFFIGGALAVAAFIGLRTLAAVASASIVVAAAAAYWWLKRKVAFQQADLPYLFRLANFPTRLTAEERQAVLDVSAGPGTQPNGRHLVIAGEIGAGKSSLCTAIGTEFAFKLGLGRYLSLTKLLQLANDERAQNPPLPAPLLDYDGGQYLWPWQHVDLLLIDDVDAGLHKAKPPTAPKEWHDVKPLVVPEELRESLTTLMRSTPPLGWMAKKRTVWVLGETDDHKIAAWRTALGAILGVAPESIAAVRLPAPSR